jgi:hypothetical protein
MCDPPRGGEFWPKSDRESQIYESSNRFEKVYCFDNYLPIF